MTAKSGCAEANWDFQGTLFPILSYVLYDEKGQRWVMSGIGVGGNHQSSTSHRVF